MEEFKKISSSEWGAPYSGAGSGPLNGIEQRDMDIHGNISAAAVLEGDEERQIQGVDILDELKGSLDTQSAYTEEERDLEEAEAVARVARANQG
jgi:hypothetical protein